jgi:PAS domain S-box-containing protein
MQPIQPNIQEGQYQGVFDAARDGLIVMDLDTGFVVDVNPAACEMHGYAHDELIGLPLMSLIHFDSRHVFGEYLRAFQWKDVFDIRAAHVRRDDLKFYTEWHGSTMMYLGRPCLLGVVRDITERVQTEQLLHHEQATLLNISYTLASTLELEPAVLLEQLQDIIAYTQGGLFTLKDLTLFPLAMRGTPQLEQSAPAAIQLNSASDILVLFNGHRPIRVGDVHGDDPAAQFLLSLLHDSSTIWLQGMQSWMWVPLAVKGRIIGGLGLAETGRNYFTVHHENLALSVANQAAITMVNAELYGHAQELAVLEERQRLAHNLHDAVNQSLFSAGLIAEVLPRLWEQDQEDGRRSLEDLRRLTLGAMAEMRALLTELRPAIITDAELADLLRLLGNAFTGRTDIPARVVVVGHNDLPHHVQLAFYRICQEALNNVAKHARAGMVEIHLVHEDTGLELTINDDGLGFDPERTASGHYGLSMMQEQADAVRAQLTITSRKGQGAEVRLRWTWASIKDEL